jgi:hypothetical protein
MRDYRAVVTMTKNLLAEPIAGENGHADQEKGLAAKIDPDGRVRCSFSQLAETE